MEFEDLKRIWDSQNKEPMYAINEATLHRRIKSKSRRASRITNMNDVGLVLVAVITAAILFFIGEQSVYDYISIVALLLIGVYVWMGRIRRKKHQNQFDRSMLGDLDFAISNIEYEVRRARTFLWWFILPVAIPSLINMIQAGAPNWKWSFVIGAFFLSLFLVRWELRNKHIPRKRELEKLKTFLINNDSE